MLIAYHLCYVEALDLDKEINQVSDPVTSITSLISASVGFVNTAMNARDAVKRDEAIGSAYDKLIQTQTQIFPLIEKNISFARRKCGAEKKVYGA